MDNKISILSLIKEKSAVLFGKFSSTIEKNDKNIAWAEIAERAKALGVVSAEKDGRYFRETTWQNWRKRAVEKRDNAKQTGSGGGKRMKLDESDKLIMEIIGTDSPALIGLGIPQSSGTSSGVMTERRPEPTPEPIPQNNSSKTRVPIGTKSRLQIGTKATKSVLEAKEEKIRLQNELIKREIYLKELEIYNREKQLNLPPSEFTKKFVRNEEEEYEQEEYLYDCEFNSDL